MLGRSLRAISAAQRKKEMLCETPFCGSALAPRAGLHPFLNDEGFWYIVVMSKCLAARSSIMGCIHFYI